MPLSVACGWTGAVISLFNPLNSKVQEKNLCNGLTKQRNDRHSLLESYVLSSFCPCSHSGSLYLVGSSLSQALIGSGTGRASIRAHIVPLSPWFPSVA